jgi:hypothetical protein
MDKIKDRASFTRPILNFFHIFPTPRMGRGLDFKKALLVRRRASRSVEWVLDAGDQAERVAIRLYCDRDMIGFQRRNRLKEIPVTDYNKFRAAAIDPAALADEG